MAAWAAAQHIPSASHAPSHSGVEIQPPRALFVLVEERTLPPLTLEVVPSESHELLNSFWVGPSGSQHPHGVKGPYIQGRRENTVFTPIKPIIHTPRTK